MPTLLTSQMVPLRDEWSTEQPRNRGKNDLSFTDDKSFFPLLFKHWWSLYPLHNRHWGQDCYLNFLSTKAPLHVCSAALQVLLLFPETSAFWLSPSLTRNSAQHENTIHLWCGYVHIHTQIWVSSTYPLPSTSVAINRQCIPSLSECKPCCKY